jgi:nicotinic acid mononucleotide adenylyltransferase
LPKKLQPKAGVTRVFRKQEMSGPLAVSGIMLHMLPETHENVSATQIRSAVDRGGALRKLVPDAVAEYIHKEHLYRTSTSRKAGKKLPSSPHEEK